MNISPADLAGERKRAGQAWPFIDTFERQYGLPAGLLYAVGSRETNLTNEVGDGGHGHGVWQLDDRSHTIPAGFDRNVQAQAAKAAAMLAALIKQFAAYGPPGALRCALAAYNAGAGTVQYNVAHGLGVDHGTAGNDYGADVFERMTWLQTNEGTDTMPTAQEVVDELLTRKLTATDRQGRKITATVASWIVNSNLHATDAYYEAVAIEKSLHP